MADFVNILIITPQFVPLLFGLVDIFNQALHGNFLGFECVGQSVFLQIPDNGPVVLVDDELLLAAKKQMLVFPNPFGVGGLHQTHEHIPEVIGQPLEEQYVLAVFALGELLQDRPGEFFEALQELLLVLGLPILVLLLLEGIFVERQAVLLKLVELVDAVLVVLPGGFPVLFH